MNLFIFRSVRLLFPVRMAHSAALLTCPGAVLCVQIAWLERLLGRAQRAAVTKIQKIKSPDAGS